MFKDGLNLHKYLHGYLRYVKYSDVGFGRNYAVDMWEGIYPNSFEFSQKVANN